jgi:type IV secretory pathway VirB10-like protein
MALLNEIIKPRTSKTMNANETEVTEKRMNVKKTSGTDWLPWIAVAVLLVALIGTVLYGVKAISNVATSQKPAENATVSTEEKAAPEAANPTVEANTSTQVAPPLPQEQIDELVAEKVAAALAKEKEKAPTPEQVQLAADQKAELERLRKERDSFEKTARERVEKELEEDRKKLAEDKENSFPGEARIVTEDFDPKKHKRNTVDKELGKKDLRVEGELPKFKVDTKPMSPKVLIDEKTGKTKIYHNVYRVLSTDGRVLTLDETPVLEDSSLVPFRLNTEGSQGFKMTWWVKK